MAKLVPLRNHHQCIGAGRHRICVLGVLDSRQLDARAFHRRRVIGTDVRARGEQDPGDVHARRLAEVVGVGLERQAEQPDDLLIELLKAVTQLVDHQHPLVAVDVHDCVEQFGVVVEALGERGQRLDILRKAVVRDQTAGSDEGVCTRNVEGVDRPRERPPADTDYAKPGRIGTLQSISRGRDALLLPAYRVEDGLTIALRDEVEKALHLIRAADLDPVRVTGRFGRATDSQCADHTKIREQAKQPVGQLAAGGSALESHARSASDVTPAAVTQPVTGEQSPLVLRRLSPDLVR